MLYIASGILSSIDAFPSATSSFYFNLASVEVAGLFKRASSFDSLVM